MRTKTNIISCAFVLLAHGAFSQEQAANYAHSSHPSELISYLFSTQGPEATEEFLLKIRDYENSQHKKVLAPTAYRNMLEKLDAEIIACTDKQRILELRARKDFFVPVTVIEK